MMTDGGDSLLEAKLVLLLSWMCCFCCPHCVAVLQRSAGMFGVKAMYCEYTELMFCEQCFGMEARQIPWRVVHMLDTKPRR